MRRVVGAILVLLGCNGPKELATFPASARLLGAADGRVYWAEGDVVGWVDPGFKEPVSFNLIGADWATRANFAAGTAGFHFSHHNKLGSFRVTGGPAARDTHLVESTVSAEAHPSGAVVDGDCVYIAEGDVDCQAHGAIFGLPIAGGDARRCQRREAPVNGPQPVEFRLDGQFFYWIQRRCSSEFSPPGGDVVALPRQGGAAIVIAPGENKLRPQDLWVGDGGVYWRSAQGIRHVAKAPFRPPVTLVEGNVESLVVAGRDVFFTRKDGVYWLDPGRREPKRLAAHGDARDLVADDRFLYWRRADGGQILRLRRPD